MYAELYLFLICIPWHTNFSRNSNPNYLYWVWYQAAKHKYIFSKLNTELNYITIEGRKENENMKYFVRISSLEYFENIEICVQKVCVLVTTLTSFFKEYCKVDLTKVGLCKTLVPCALD